VCVTVVGSWEALCQQVAATGARLVLIDLEHRDADLRRLKEVTSGRELRPQTVAYASHVKELLLEAARESGCDLVLSRGQFDQRIGELLASLASPTDTDSA
jgi:hypothetical protein